jgi:hypothetical protein
MGGKWGATSNQNSEDSTEEATGDVDTSDSGWSVWGTPLGDTNHRVGNMYDLADQLTSGGTEVDDGTATMLEWYPYDSGAGTAGATGNVGQNCMFTSPSGLTKTSALTAANRCADSVTEKGLSTDNEQTVGEPRPYDGATGAWCSPVHIGSIFNSAADADANGEGDGTDSNTISDAVSSADTSSSAGTMEWCRPLHATDYQAPINGASKHGNAPWGGVDGGEADSTTYNSNVYYMNSGTGSAMKFPPLDTSVRISDNDAVVDQTALSSSCRQTRLFQYADASDTTYTDVVGSGVHKTEWLVDYNCKNGDAGGLPGYPADAAISGDAGIDGDGQCAGGTTGPYCT